MIEILRHRNFRRLFLAQVVALVGTGLTTLALALLAYDIAGAQAGAVLGTALAIKMTVYVMLAPLAGALVPSHLRKRVLIGLDLVRAAAAMMLPFVTEIWQVYALIALLQSASACFTPLFQSLIPQILPQERDYTRALSLSRLAYDLESLLSPALAAALRFAPNRAPGACMCSCRRPLRSRIIWSLSRRLKRPRNPCNCRWCSKGTNRRATRGSFACA